ncbi:hypothetical protein EII33_05960 [Bacteroides heparinolyticus]|uniref:Transmembrane protein n=1 Tax=Prevotella heparinolytica TaxID=28113 RepID=A0A3P2A980_9BACE|nr:hypothetical protein [Bacteroides heparinolyticus]RRD91957.1 hypothetical protein EII33_05960 [Bacteroides heparinolyticus]
MKDVFVLFILCLSLISCSSEKEEEKSLSNKAKNTITWLEQLQESGDISEVTFQEAKENIQKYDNRFFLWKYCFFLVFIIYIIASSSYIYFITDKNLDRRYPLSKWYVYSVWLYSGLFGGHISLLWNNHHTTISAIWRFFSYTIVIIAFIFNYTAIMYFYDMPSILRLYDETWKWSMPNSYFLHYSLLAVELLFLVNIIGGLLFIPYWTYVYNALYFRRHHENDKILSGKPVKIDFFYKQLSKHIKELNKNLEEIKVYVEQDYYIEDPNKDYSFWGDCKRFFKNIATLGNSSKLEKEVDRLRLLNECCIQLQEDIQETEYYNDTLYSFLEKYRIAAYRNLFLAKELIAIIKTKISSQQQSLIVDEFKSITTPDPFFSGIDFRASDITFNSDNFFVSVENKIEDLTNELGKRLEREQNLSKEDFINAGIELGIHTAIEAITNIINLYSDTLNARKEVNENIRKSIRYIDKAIPAIQKYQVALMRESEVLLALSKCNKAFIHAYEPLRIQVFGKPTFGSFLKGIKKNQAVFKTEEFHKKLHHLILVSSEYNKINQIKA